MSARGFLDMIGALDAGEQRTLLRALGLDEARGADGDWPSWAHEGQRAPAGDWRTWVIMAGRGFGKTLAGAQWILECVRGCEPSLPFVSSEGFPERRRRVETRPSTSLRTNEKGFVRSGVSTSLDTNGEGFVRSGVSTSLDTNGEGFVRSGVSTSLDTNGEGFVRSGVSTSLDTNGEGFVRSGVSTSLDTDGEGFGLPGVSTALDTNGVAAAGGPLRIALVGATLDDARRVMVEGKSGLLEVAGDWVADWHPTRRLIRFTTGAEATLFSGASPEALRGPEHHIAWCDELAKWERPGECWDMLQLGLRLGNQPRALVTTTPRPGPVLKRIMASAGCVTTGGSTRANPHLPDAFLEQVETLYAGTRLGRQELEGELLADTPGALWTVELLERCRISAPRQGGNWARIVIAVDPPSGDGTCGIVACGRDRDGIGHVLADHSVSGRSPEGWARAVADAAAIHGAQMVVAEQNQGGKMVAAVLRTADAALRVKLVTAGQGKMLRAEPVAHLFEAGKVVLHGRFAALEAELIGMIAGGDYEGPGTSPDRADAMVWGLTELMLEKEQAAPRVRTF